MQQSKIKTNVLIIGKSGVGKSSLLNYIFGKELEKTGAGKPISEGINTHDYEYDDEFVISISDTEGLEPGKAEQWKKLILNEVKSHDEKEICEWFNTIIYCFSANSGKVEDFEINIIKELLQEKNQVTVVITNCDNENDSSDAGKSKRKTIKAMIDRITEKTGIAAADVVPVCSVKKILLNGKEVAPTGKEKIITLIIENLWKTFREKIPFKLYQYENNEYYGYATRISKVIKETSFLFHKIKKVFDVGNRVSNFLQDYDESVRNDVDSLIQESSEYYHRLSKKYLNISWKYYYDDQHMPQISLEYINKVNADVDNIIEALHKSNKKIYNLFIKEDVSKEVIKNLLFAIMENVKRSKEIRKTLDGIANKQIVEIHDRHINALRKVKENIEATNIEECYTKQLELKKGDSL